MTKATLFSTVIIPRKSLPAKEILTGIGILLALLGSMIFLLAKADEISKRAKVFAKEKGIENRSVLREKLSSSQ